MTPESAKTSAQKRRERRRRARRHGVINPLYWPCPLCLADPHQNCRRGPITPLPEGLAFHTERIRETAAGPGFVTTTNRSPTRPSFVSAMTRPD
jgi:hypothetical protein